MMPDDGRLIAGRYASLETLVIRTPPSLSRGESHAAGTPTPVTSVIAVADSPYHLFSSGSTRTRDPFCGGFPRPLW